MEHEEKIQQIFNRFVQLLSFIKHLTTRYANNFDMEKD